MNQMMRRLSNAATQTQNDETQKITHINKENDRYVKKVKKKTLQL